MQTFTGWYKINNRKIDFKLDYPSASHLKNVFFKAFKLKESDYFYECKDKRYYEPKTDRVYKKRKKKKV